MDVETAQRRCSAWQTAFVMAGLGLIVFAVKIIFIARFGSSTPYWDQWDAEANLLYKPYLNSTLNWAGLLSPHNEHRILFSRLLSIALFEFAGGWDPILQMIVNGALHVVAIVLLVLTIQRILDGAQVLMLGLFAAFLFILPLGWENLLAGFQSQFYALLIFSFLALTGFAISPALGRMWWLTCLCAVGAFFSMASGALIGFASLAVMIVQIVVGVRRERADYVAAVLLMLMSIIMVSYVPHIDGHDVLKAHNATEFVKAVLVILDFPLSKPPVGVWINLPLVIYSVFVLVSRPDRRSPHWIILSLIVWWFGQILSLSYGRASASTSSRYLDIIMIGLPLNFGVLLFAVKQFEFSRRRLVLPIVGFWLFVTSSGLIFMTVYSAFPLIIQKAAEGHEQRTNVVAYLRTGDLSVLQNKPYLTIPYPNPEWLAFLLSDPTIRLALPESIRPADVDPRTALARTQLKGRLRPVAIAVKFGLIQLAPALAGLGIALLFLARLAGRRETDRSGLDQPAVQG